MAEVKEPSAEWLAGARWLCEQRDDIAAVHFDPTEETSWTITNGSDGLAILYATVADRNRHNLRTTEFFHGRHMLPVSFTRAELLSPVAKPEPGGELCEACGASATVIGKLASGDFAGSWVCGACVHEPPSVIHDRIRSRRQQQKQAEQGAPEVRGEPDWADCECCGDYAKLTERTYTQIDEPARICSGCAMTTGGFAKRLQLTKIRERRLRRAYEMARMIERARERRLETRRTAPDPYRVERLFNGSPATDADIALLTAEADAAAFEKLSASQRRERARREREPMKRETSNPHWLEAWSSPTYESDH